MKVSVSNPVDNYERLPCTNCASSTRHKVLATVQATSRVDADVDDDDDDPFGSELSVVDWYNVVQCQGCEEISFWHQTADDRDSVYDEETGRTESPQRNQLYPPRIAGRSRLPGEGLMPENVRRIYQETHAALCSDLPILAGIGMRAIVEAVCKERGAKGKALEAGIQDLVEQSVVTPAGAEILHRLRFMGNVAAHEVTAHKDSELQAGFNVIDHLLTTVYILPAQAEQLPGRD